MLTENFVFLVIIFRQITKSMWPRQFIHDIKRRNVCHVIMLNNALLFK